MNSLSLLSTGCWSFLVWLKNLILTGILCASHEPLKLLTELFIRLLQNILMILSTKAIVMPLNLILTCFQILISIFIIFTYISTIPSQTQLLPRPSNPNIHYYFDLIHDISLNINNSQDSIPRHLQNIGLYVLYDNKLIYTGNSTVYPPPPPYLTKTTNTHALKYTGACAKSSKHL